MFIQKSNIIFIHRKSMKDDPKVLKEFVDNLKSYNFSHIHLTESLAVLELELKEKTKIKLFIDEDIIQFNFPTNSVEHQLIIDVLQRLPADYTGDSGFTVFSILGNSEDKLTDFNHSLKINFNIKASIELMGVNFITDRHSHKVSFTLKKGIPEITIRTEFKFADLHQIQSSIDHIIADSSENLYDEMKKLLYGE